MELGRPWARAEGLVGPAAVGGGTLLASAIAIYALPSVASPELNLYLLQPLMWLSLGFLAYRLWWRELDEVDFTIDRWLIGLAALVALFQIALFLMAGVLGGFGNSPYARHPALMALNLWFVATRLVGLELARWYLVFALGRYGMLIGAAAAWLLFTVVAVSPASLGQLGQAETAFRLTGRTLFPIASENLLATYLVIVGGPLASIAYRGTLAAFEWLSPILPNVRWTATAFIGTVAPILGVLIVRELIEAREARERWWEREKKASLSVGWVLVAVLAVALFWFNTGLFGVRPVLISGISMEPTMKVGDIAITREVSAADVKVGSVIRFRQGNISIVHRVLDIRKEGGRTTFITKGDNNNVEDKPVDASQLEGQVVVQIPKIGWLPIGAKLLVSTLFQGR